jgi:hypothetical protein
VNFLSIFLFYSKLIDIFAAEFQVPQSVGGRFNGSNKIKERLTFILPQKRGKFLISKGNGNMLTFGIIVPFQGIIYLITWAIASLLADR